VASGPIRARPRWAGVPALPGRLLRLEVRRSAMVWMVPLVAVLFWFDTYRSTMKFAAPPLWSLRIFYLEKGNTLADFVPFVAGLAAWMGSRDGRRGTADLVAVTARPRWAARLAACAAATCWALAAYLGCVGVLYGVTARQAVWGGPLWWPAAVGAAGVVAVCVAGFAAGALFPGRFTAPLAAAGALLVALAGQTAAQLNSTFAQVSPVQSGLAIRLDAGLFYPFLPDVPIAQVMFLTGLAVAALGALGLPADSGGRRLRRAAAAFTAAGLLAAGTALGLAGTTRPRPQGVVIPALHDAANDRPIPYTPVCGHAAIPVCVHPAYRAYLPDLAAAFGPVFSAVAGLPGVPVRAASVAPQQDVGPSAAAGGGMIISGSPPVLLVPMPDLPDSFGVTTADFIGEMRSAATVTIVTNVIGGGFRPHDSPGQQAIAAALLKVAGAADTGPAPPIGPVSAARSASHAAALRFAALPAAIRRAWLTAHLAALRAGLITPAQIP
jgi:hypothetical protein